MESVGVASAKRLLIVGLPEVGKTSFIHAVDEVLQDPPDDKAFRSFRLADDRTALEKDKEKFRGGMPVGRTERHAGSAPPELFFEDPVSNRRGHLIVPDLDGEVFTDQWQLRACEESYHKSLDAVAGLLLFIRADLPASNDELLGELVTLMAKEDSLSRPWDPRKASSQVQLVDVLQTIANFRETKPPLRTAVIVSAWDVVMDPGYPRDPSPEEFLSSDWALLDQFLRSNHENFSTRIFGVSALGGNLAAQKELAKLPPRQRVKVAYGSEVSGDVTSPLRWLLELE